jgi:protoporphyrinogen/coproporphyrinogen III oxidase
VPRPVPPAGPPGTVVVIGAGVAGLTAAFEILERGERLAARPDVHVLEAGSRAGGNIRTERADGFLCEAGPTGFLDDAPATLTLARRLGLRERLCRADAASARRYVFRAGRLHRVPTGPREFLTTTAVPRRAKLRALLEPFARRAPAEDESVHAFAERRIGRGAADVLVDAMVAGVYAGDSRALSLEATFPKVHAMEREHGSLLRAFLARRRRSEPESEDGRHAGSGGTLTSFVSGFAELTDALAHELGDRVRLGCCVSRVVPLGQRGFRILPSQGAPIEADAVIVACPAWDAGPMLADADDELGRVLGEIGTVPLAVVHTGFRTLALGDQPSGFGFLVPRGQGLRILGTLWSSQIFPGRAPDSASLLTTMVGGAHDPAAAALADKKLIELVRADLQAAMGFTVQPYFTRIVRWPRSIPQYTIGHPERLRVIERRLGEHTGLFLAGSSYRGVSVNSCIEEAGRIAESVLQFLESRKTD